MSTEGFGEAKLSSTPMLVSVGIAGVKMANRATIRKHDGRNIFMSSIVSFRIEIFLGKRKTFQDYGRDQIMRRKESAKSIKNSFP